MRRLEARPNLLQQLSGLHVAGWFDEERNTTYFEFREEENGPVLTSTYTYNKAKVLA